MQREKVQKGINWVRYLRQGPRSPWGEKCPKGWVRRNQAELCQHCCWQTEKERNPGAEFLGWLENRGGHSLSSQRREIVGPQRLRGVEGGRASSFSVRAAGLLAHAYCARTAQLRNTAKYGRVYMGKPVCLKYYSSLQGWGLFLENYICWWELF